MSKKSEKVRHILALSGGKDSAALAVHLRGKIPDLEYVFMDTGHELPETYEYLNRIRAILNIQIKVITSEKPFEYWLKLKNYFLPSPQHRWCTEVLKIKPYENYIGTDKVNSYIGIRADENRDGYISSKSNITPYYPFIEDGLVYSDIEYLLESSGLGFPAYYKWRSRSGCYFCFFQQKIEWLNLHRYHGDLFKRAMALEKFDPTRGTRFTWNQDESLTELLAREAEIRRNNDRSSASKKIVGKGGCKLVDILPGQPGSCIICE